MLLKKKEAPDKSWYYVSEQSMNFLQCIKMSPPGGEAQRETGSFPSTETMPRVLYALVAQEDEFAVDTARNRKLLKSLNRSIHAA